MDNYGGISMTTGEKPVDMKSSIDPNFSKYNGWKLPRLMEITYESKIRGLGLDNSETCDDVSDGSMIEWIGVTYVLVLPIPPFQP
jgi:hypothetical protein